MDPLRFINSKDVRAYLEQIGYVFSPSETAWLIYQCRGLTLKERHAAWRQLAAESPDAPFLTAAGARQHLTPPPIGDFLRRYVEREEALLARFSQNDGSFVYCLRADGPSDVSVEDTHKGILSRAFFRFEECVAALKEWYPTAVKECGEDEIRKEYVIYCRTLGSGAPLKTDSLTVRCDGEALSVEGCYNDDCGEGDAADLPDPWCSFRQMWFAFPSPFRAGDILYDPGPPSKYGLGGPVAVTETTPDFYARTGRSGIDYTDMTVYGYFQNEDGTVFQALTDNYMDFEYYPPERLTGKQRILAAVSEKIRGKIDLERFSEVYLYLLAEEAAKKRTPLSFQGEDF